MEIGKLAGAALLTLMMWPAALADDTSAEPAPPYASSELVLVGPVWRLTELDGEPAADDVETTLTFSQDGQVGGDGGCNTYGGDYHVSGERLTFANIFSTMMACPDQETPQEQAFFAALEATESFEIVEEELLLEDAEGAVLARFAE